MKQPGTRGLFEYWDALRAGRSAPDRGDIDPGAIRACLADTFILDFDPARGHPFRIAGTAVCTLFGRELTGSPFLGLWEADSRNAVSDTIRSMVADPVPATADLRGTNADGETVSLEMIVLPLRCADEGGSRLLGALTPLVVPYWLGNRPLHALHLGSSKQPSGLRHDRASAA